MLLTRRSFCTLALAFFSPTLAAAQVHIHDGPAGHDLWRVRDARHKYGYLHFDSTTVIPYRFDQADNFYEASASVSAGGKVTARYRDQVRF